MSALELTMTNNADITIIPSILLLIRRFYKKLKLFTGLLGISFVFPIYLLLLPILILYIRKANARLEKFIDKINLSTKPEQYDKYRSLYHALQKSLNKISDREGDYVIPNKSNKWYLRPVTNEMIKFHSIMVNFKNKLSKELYFDLREQGLSEEDINKAKSQLNSYDEDWEDNDDWKSFENKYNKYSLQS